MSDSLWWTEQVMHTWTIRQEHSVPSLLRGLRRARDSWRREARIWRTRYDECKAALDRENAVADQCAEEAGQWERDCDSWKRRAESAEALLDDSYSGRETMYQTWEQRIARYRAEFGGSK